MLVFGGLGVNMARAQNQVTEGVRGGEDDGDDEDASFDEAPVELPGAADGEEALAPEDEEFEIPPPEVMAKFPTFVTALAKTTVTLQNPQYRYRMDKWMPETFLGLLFIGRLHKHIGLTAGLFGLAKPQVVELPDFSTGRILDFLASLQIEPAEWFNVWRLEPSPAAASPALLTPPARVSPQETLQRQRPAPHQYAQPIPPTSTRQRQAPTHPQTCRCPPTRTLHLKRGAHRLNYSRE